MRCVCGGWWSVRCVWDVSGVCDGGALVIAHFRGHLCVFDNTTGDSLHWGGVWGLGVCRQGV